MSSTATDDLGKLVLRLTLGILLILHGVAKLKGGVGWLEGSLVGKGLPGMLAYGVYLGEVLAPLFLILGLFTRLGALLVMVNMMFAIGLMHMSQLFMLGQSGGWALELQGFFILTAVSVFLLGPGRHAMGGRSGYWS